MSSAGGADRWVLCAPTGPEAAALRRGAAGTGPGGRVTVRRTGAGPRRAGRAAATLAGTAPLALAGVGGGLDPALRPGEVVVASEVRVAPAPGGGAPDPVPMPAAAALAAALRRDGVRVRLGPVVSTARPVSGRAARRALAATGALVVDLESGWLLSRLAPRPLACVRVVADPAGERLYRPGTVGRLWTALRVLPGLVPALAEWAAAATAAAGGQGGLVPSG